MLQIAELENDKKAVVKIALNLFYSGNCNFAFYNKMKENSSKEEWQQLVAEILQKLNSQKYWIKPYGIFAKIYFEEQEWDKLLATATKYDGFDMLEKYEAILNQHFPSQLIALYERSIRNYLENNVDRSHYVITCKAIKRLKAIIPTNDVTYLINELKEKYKRRPALMELINKI